MGNQNSKQDKIYQHQQINLISYLGLKSCSQNRKI